MLPNKTDIAEFFLNIRIISHWFTFWSRKSWATTASILLYTTSEQFPDPIIIAQFFKNDNTIRKELPFAWMKHPVVHMDKTSIVVYTEQDMIMILQKKKGKEIVTQQSKADWPTAEQTKALDTSLQDSNASSNPSHALLLRIPSHIYTKKVRIKKKKKTRGEVKRKHNMIDSLLSTIVVLDILTDIIRCNG